MRGMFSFPASRNSSESSNQKAPGCLGCRNLNVCSLQVWERFNGIDPVEMAECFIFSKESLFWIYRFLK